MEKTKSSAKIKIGIDKTNKIVSWQHPGGKLLRLGSESLTDAELLAIIIGAGSPGITAEVIANKILMEFQSFRGMSGQDETRYMQIKGINKVKFTRIAACWEIAGRIVKMVLADKEKYDRQDNQSI